MEPARPSAQRHGALHGVDPAAGTPAGDTLRTRTQDSHCPEGTATAGGSRDTDARPAESDRPALPVQQPQHRHRAGRDGTGEGRGLPGRPCRHLPPHPPAPGPLLRDHPGGAGEPGPLHGSDCDTLRTVRPSADRRGGDGGGDTDRARRAAAAGGECRQAQPAVGRTAPAHPHPQGG